MNCHANIREVQRDEYENLVSLLDSLIDEVGENENHPLASLMESIGSLVETYDSPIG
ncbi:Transcriptional regulator [Candidatus Electrothrix laxa]